MPIMATSTASDRDPVVTLIMSRISGGGQSDRLRATRGPNNVSARTHRWERRLSKRQGGRPRQMATALPLRGLPPLVLLAHTHTHTCMNMSSCCSLKVRYRLFFFFSFFFLGGGGGGRGSCSNIFFSPPPPLFVCMFIAR